MNILIIAILVGAAVVAVATTNRNKRAVKRAPAPKPASAAAPKSKAGTATKAKRSTATRAGKTRAASGKTTRARTTRAKASSARSRAKPGGGAKARAAAVAKPKSAAPAKAKPKPAAPAKARAKPARPIKARAKPAAVARARAQPAAPAKPKAKASAKPRPKPKASAKPRAAISAKTKSAGTPKESDEKSTYASGVARTKRLIRANKSADAVKQLAELVGMTEVVSKKSGDSVDPWCYEQLAVHHRNNKDYASEVAILERYGRQHIPAGPASTKLAQRLSAARTLQKQQG